jgi:hypothetical protein
MTILQGVAIVAIYALLVCLPSCIHYVLISREFKKIDREYNRLFNRD